MPGGIGLDFSCLPPDRYTESVVLSGALGVPCCPKSSSSGAESPPEGGGVSVSFEHVVLKAGSHAAESV